MGWFENDGRGGGMPTLPMRIRHAVDDICPLPILRLRPQMKEKVSGFPAPFCPRGCRQNARAGDKTREPPFLSAHHCDPPSARRRRHQYSSRLARARLAGHCKYLRRDRLRNEGQGGRKMRGAGHGQSPETMARPAGPDGLPSIAEAVLLCGAQNLLDPRRLWPLPVNAT